MKLNATKFGVASAVAFAILWVICSLFVVVMPGMMMEMSGHMVHTDLAGIQWHMGLTSVVIGLFAWSFVAGITGWLVATIYNRLI